MNIIRGENVDLIEPFPSNQFSRLWGWTKASKTITALDGTPQTEEDFIDYITRVLSYSRGFGVIDKHNTLNIKHEAPLVGFIMFEPSPPCSVYAHVASTRRCWGTGLMYEAGKLAINEIFSTEPGIQRISACIPAAHKQARKFAEKIGMHKDGYFRNSALMRGKPISLAHYGLVRERKEEEQCQSEQ